jgi:hypothetical protein
VSVDEDLLPAALDALRRFWRVLSGDDDVALLRLTAASLHQRVGTGAGMCARLRALNGIEPDECRRMGTLGSGTAARAYILPASIEGPPQIAFVCREAGGHTVPVPVLAGVPIEVRRPIMNLEHGLWRFAGMLDYPGGWPEGTKERDVPIPELPPNPVH